MKYATLARISLCKAMVKGDWNHDSPESPSGFFRTDELYISPVFK